MNPIKRSLLASLILAAAVPAFAGADFPFLVTGVVRDAADGTSATGMRWTAWSDAAPAVRTSGRLGDERIGAVRPGAFYGDIGSSAASAGGQWTVIVSGTKRGRAYAAITRGSLSGHPAVFPSTRLVILPAAVGGLDPSRSVAVSLQRPDAGSVGSRVGDVLAPGQRVRRAGARSLASPSYALCVGAGGVTEVVAEGAADAGCVPLLRAASAGGLGTR